MKYILLGFVISNSIWCQDWAAVRVVGVEYPHLARLGGIKGKVEVRLVLDEAGAVKSVIPLNGHHLLVPKVEENARMWRFRRAGTKAEIGRDIP